MCFALAWLTRCACTFAVCFSAESCNGTVFDVSSSELFKTTYAAWAGKDATYALGFMSLDENDAVRTDWGSMGAKERKTCEDWERYFREKYLVRGRLKEFDQFLKDDKNAL